MKSLPALLAIALLGLGAAACGGAGKATGPVSQVSSHVAPAGSTAARTVSGATSTRDYTKADRDKDNDFGPYDDTSNREILDFGHAASASGKRAITALVKRYYATAAAGDGASACSMLYVTFAEAVPEDYGKESAGPSYLSQGKTCPSVMALLFEHMHGQLTSELPLLEVTRVRLEQHHGLAVLSFGTMPERQIRVRREGHTWKIIALLDSELP